MGISNHQFLRRLALAVAGVVAALLLLPALAGASPSAVPDTSWVTNGSVYATATDGTTTWLGGTFTQVGPRTGPGASFTTTTSAYDTGAVQVQGGYVNAVEGDGAGGWYLGGTFTAVDGVPRNRLAHVTALGLLDMAWDPNANSTVYALVRSGTTLYAGGAFSSIGGLARGRVAALSTTGTGGATDFDPSANNQVFALAISGSTLYVGGMFTSIGGQLRDRAAAIDTTFDTGNATGWDPSANNYVRALAIDGSGNIILGGDFTQLAGTARLHIGSITAAGALNPFDPAANNTVYSLAVSGSTIYAGGSFTVIDSQSRPYLAALDSTTGNATGWAPAANAIVRTMLLDGTALYVGGDFTLVGGQVRNRLAAVDTTSGVALAFNPNVGNSVYAIALQGSKLYAGGAFGTIGAIDRNRLAAIDNASGLPTAWNPNANNTVNTMVLSGNTLYVGGSFSNIGGSARSYIAALDTIADTSNATTFNPGANSSVTAMVLDGTTLYVGGGFSTIGGQPRSRIAALNTTFAVSNATTWDPSADSTVSTLLLRGTTMYAGGTFTTIGGLPRNRIAALDTTVSAGTATAFDPNANSTVLTLAGNGTTIYAGGSFTSIGGRSRNYIAALDDSTGVASAWNPGSSSTVYALATAAGSIWAGGNFTVIGGQSRAYLAELDPTSNSSNASGWAPNMGAAVRTIGFTPSGALQAGGDFNSTGATLGVVSPTNQASFAQFSLPVSAGIAPTVSGTARDGQVLTCSPGTWGGSLPQVTAQQWTRDGVAIGGATASSYTLVGADVGNTIGCTVTQSNGAGPLAAQSNTVVPLPLVPVNSLLPSIVGVAQDGRTLSCIVGTWSGSPTSYTWTWQRDGMPIGASSTYALVSGDVSHNITCSVTASNVGGASIAAVSASVIPVPLAPVLTTAPAITGVAAQGQIVTCGNGSWSPAATTYTFRWKRGGTAIGSQTASTYTLTVTDVGQSVTCEVTASNTGGTGAPAESGGVVSIGPVPVVASAPVVTGTAMTGQNLACSLGTWTQTPTSYARQWKRNGAVIGGATGVSYVLVGADLGNSITCEVTATNAAGAGAPASSVAVVPVAQAPVLLAAPTLTGIAQQGNALTCTAGTWTDSPSGYTYRWLRDGVTIALQTSSMMTLVGADATHAVACAVTATNAGGSSAEASSGAVVVLLPAPANTVAPSIAGTAQVGQILICSEGSWNGAPTSFARQWKAAGSDIIGQTGLGYTITPLDAGVAITCAVTATGAGGTNAAVSSNSLTPLPAAPVVTVAPAISGTAQQGMTVSCSSGSWNGLPTGYAIRWLRDGVAIVGATTSNYLLLAADTGHAIDCRVIATNTGGASIEAVSAAIVPLPPVPAVTVAPTISGTAQVGMTVTCDEGSWSNGATGYTRQWKNAGSIISGATARTYLLVGADAGAAVTCEVTATGPGGVSVPATTTPIVATPAVPTNLTAPAVTGTAQEGQTLTCTNGGWNGSPTGYTYHWLRDGVAIAGAVASIHVLAVADTGHAIGCGVVATNAGGPSVAALSGSIVSLPQAPGVTVAPTISGTAQVGQLIVCNQGTWSNGATSFARQWKRGGVDISGETASSYVLVTADAAASISCAVTATGPGGVGGVATTAPVTPLPAVPVVSVPPVVSGTFQLGQSLACTNGTWSPVPTTHVYRWLRDGTTIPGEVVAAHLVGIADVGHVVACAVTAANIGGAGIEASSQPVIVLPGAPTILSSPSIAGTAQVGQVVICNEGTWNGSPTGFARQWTRGGAAITGQTALGYTLVGGDAAQSIACEVTATGPGGTSLPIASAAISPLPAAPTVTTAPSLSGTVSQGNLVTCSPGTWTGSPSSYAFVWLRNDVPIALEVFGVHLITPADTGNAIACRVVANGPGGASLPSTSSGTVALPPAPSLLSLPTVTGSGQVGQSMVCDTGSWSGAPTFTRQWRLDGADIAGSTGSSYVVQAGDLTHGVTCAVVATNAGGASTPVESTPVTAVPTPPVLAIAPAITGLAREGETLTCGTGSWSGTPTSYVTRWTRGGVSIVGATAVTYIVSTGDVGSPLACTVIAANAGGASATATSGAVVPDALPPTSILLPHLLGTAQPGLTMACDTGSWTNTPTSYTREWRRDGVAILGATGTAYVVQAADIAVELTCAVTATNSAGSATAESTAVVAVAGALPLPTIVAQPGFVGDAKVGNVVGCTPGSWTNTPDHYGFRWTRDGVVMPGQDTNLLVLDAAAIGHSVGCVVEAFNGAGSGLGWSPSQIVAGLPPAALAAPSVIGMNREGSTLTCDPGLWEASTLSVGYQWTHDGVTVAGARTPTYLVQPLDVGHAIACRIIGSGMGGSTTQVSQVTSVLPRATITLSVRRTTKTSAVHGDLQVRRGSFVVLGGTVRDDRGNRAGGVLVSLRLIGKHGKVLHLGVARTNKLGRFRKNVRIRSSGSFRAMVGTTSAPRITASRSHLVKVVVHKQHKHKHHKHKHHAPKTAVAGAAASPSGPYGGQTLRISYFD